MGAYSPEQEQGRREQTTGRPTENGVQTAADAAGRRRRHTARQVPHGDKGERQALQQADKLANMGAEIEEGHRIVERGSAEPPRDEHKDNG